ncbi:PHP domain-containing protein [Salinispira pacifica]|uniref:Putative metal-dependent phosphoesterases (PHP family) n=1 Tax=Salinispira pacifica TaxID=1307761 RepID=V5WD13_9SPIO|nr:PHP domain-containing protein [Salinispira pacifica]AHC13708.1 putative metal-dependent phosphoesterases (PHP family) [Salinispira pacifica]
MDSQELRTFKADIHLHSCLSPCGSLFSSPGAIAREAVKKGLDLIALTDHNSAANCPAFRDACRREGIACMYGMEVTTSEELHCLAIFEHLSQALDADGWISSRIQRIPLKPERMGDQVIVDVSENILGTIDYLLISATDIPLSQLVEEVRERDGLVIPAHVDRANFSLISQLGFIPHDRYHGLEWYRKDNPMIDSYPGYPVLYNSDAHMIEDIGRRSTEFRALTADFQSFRHWLETDQVTAS